MPRGAAGHPTIAAAARVRRPVAVEHRGQHCADAVAVLAHAAPGAARADATRAGVLGDQDAAAGGQEAGQEPVQSVVAGVVHLVAVRRGPEQDVLQVLQEVERLDTGHQDVVRRGQHQLSIGDCQPPRQVQGAQAVRGEGVSVREQQERSDDDELGGAIS